LADRYFKLTYHYVTFSIQLSSYASEPQVNLNNFIAIVLNSFAAPLCDSHQETTDRKNVTLNIGLQIIITATNDKQNREITRASSQMKLT
jgi:hypothetical protein